MPQLLGIRSAATLVVAALLTAACASSPPQNSSRSEAQGENGVDRAVTKTSEGLDDAALTPLNDFNLRRTEIPKRLLAITSPYEPLAARTCTAIAEEVEELTMILGPDADAPVQSDETLGQKAGDGAANLALGSVASAASDFIPFRSVVREATGASAHERRMRAAYERGIQRRAYVKGVGAAMGCSPPAAPDPEGLKGPAGPPIEYRKAG
jgi:hypothetical protein